MRGKKHDGVQYASLQDFSTKPASSRYDTRCYTWKSSCHAAVPSSSRQWRSMAFPILVILMNIFA